MTNDELKRLKSLGGQHRRRGLDDEADWRLLRKLAALEVESMEYRLIELRALADGLPMPLLSDDDTDLDDDFIEAEVIDGEIVIIDDGEDG